METKADGEIGKKSIPELGLYLRPATGAFLKGKQGDLGSWWGTGWGLCQGGGSPHLCLLYILYINLFLTPGFWGWAPHPLPLPIYLSLTIKFSIFGVLVSYFSGTERRSERDWKQPFVFRSCLNFPIPTLCPSHILDLPTVLQSYLSTPSPCPPP